MQTLSVNKKCPKVFIVSSGRAGTTLLTSILNASEQMYFPYESDFVARAYPHYKNQTYFQEQDYQLIVNFFRQSSQFNGWGMTEPYLLSYLKQYAPQNLADIFSTICEAYHQLNGTKSSIWGIKSPVLIASIDRICAVYPTAKFVHLVRDGRDVYLSYQDIHQNSPVKFGPKGLIASALYWVDGLRNIEHHIQTQKIYEIRYEDLLANASEEIRKLCLFLDIEYDPSMLVRYNRSLKEQSPEWQNFCQSCHKKLNEDIDKNNSGKYLKTMSKLERFVFELLTIPYLYKYQYLTENKILNAMIFNPVREIVYFLSRQFNVWRYARRDQAIYVRACK